ncbi:MAG: hypothetical protein IPK20_17930 [Betaproteobacteria bacterium]|nr:hypothetical protein [Betaproteobacteria bacterium]
MDPVSFSDGDLHSFNRYAYGNNNPYRYRDNDGRLPVLLLVPLALKAIDVTLTAIDLIAAYQSDGAAGVAKEGIVAAAGVVVPGGRTLGAIAKHGDEVVTYAAKGVHKNSLSYVGETHVYRIKGPDGATHKIGESARGLNAEGASIRAEQQARRLTRETGDVYTTEIRKTFPDKASAREYETRVIERFRSMYGRQAAGNLKLDERMATTR